jgi:hypothetical protein
MKDSASFCRCFPFNILRICKFSEVKEDQRSFQGRCNHKYRLQVKVKLIFAKWEKFFFCFLIKGTRFLNSHSEPAYSFEQRRQYVLTNVPLKVYVKRCVLIYISVSADLVVLKCNM